MITDDEYKHYLFTRTCVWCGRRITRWKMFVRVFWAPWWCDVSIFWKICCSSRCNTKFLEHEIEGLKKP